METRRIRSFAAMFAASALFVGLAVTGSGVIAQDAATPTDGMMAAHPAHIHSGTCDTLGDVVIPLNDLMAPGMMGSPEAEMDMATPEAGTDDMAMGEVVAESTTTVEATFDVIFGAEHAINVHESAENIGNYVACGDLTGEPSAEGVLEIQLEELNDSGLEGMATLTDNGDGTLEVYVAVMQVTDGGMASPEASPTS